MSSLITLHKALSRMPEMRLKHPVSMTLAKGECVVVTGRNGSGKSLLAHLLSGGATVHPDMVSRTDGLRVRFQHFRDAWGDASPAYYQQRWNKWDDETTFPLVDDCLARVASGVGHEELIRMLRLDSLRGKTLNLLSSGELRRMQLFRVLADTPHILIIDNPYIGLDAEAREALTQLMGQLALHTTLVLLIAREDEIPPCATRIIEMEDGAIKCDTPAAAWQATPLEQGVPRANASLCKNPEMDHHARNVSQEVVDMEHLTLTYDGHTLLNDLCWRVGQGEHWALLGRNGSGKSTILSLICADNPQAYAMPLRLFGKKRGGGESIWDIKRRIGYVSPELYNTYRKNLHAIDIVASGLHDTVGLYRKATDEERTRCLTWMERFGVEDLCQKNYLTLSSGQQRLMLLVRAFVKHPDLLILDEPFHGLDNHARWKARRIIDEYMYASDKRTLIMVTHYPEELPTCINRIKRL